MKIRLFTGPGTRRWPRFNLADVHSVKGVRSDAGFGIEVGNISRGGALLRTRKRLAPGSRIQLGLTIVEGEIGLTGIVLRSSRTSLKETLRYQAAVAFDNPLQLLDGQASPTLESLPSGDGDSNGADSIFRSAFLSVSAQETALYEMCKLNDW